MRKVNLKLNPAKCTFLRKEPKRTQKDPEKTKVVKEYPRPQNSDDVKRFIAFANYYRKFISKFAEKAYPLNKLCSKNVAFVWTDCENSFNYLKTALVEPPLLQYPDFSTKNEFILQTDASGLAIGAVLCNSNGLPVAYASRSLNKAEVNYPTIEKELLAIVWGVKYFRPYLYGRKFKIQTDHSPLVYLFGMRDPSSRLMKFRLQIEEYNFYIEYIRGKHNNVADALSRIRVTSDELKQMNERIMNVMTRAQARKMNQCNQSQDKLTVSVNNE